MKGYFYSSELRVDRQGPKAWEARCYAIRDSHSVLVADGYGRTEDEAVEDAHAWMVAVGRMAPDFLEMNPEYHRAPLLGKKARGLLIACVAFAALGCASLASNMKLEEIPPVPPVSQVDVPQQNLQQIRESMKVLSNPGDEELARQFTVLRLLRDPCGIPKAMVAYAQHREEWAAGHAVYDYLEEFKEDEKYKAVKDHPMVGVSEDFLFSLMDQ